MLIPLVVIALYCFFGGEAGGSVEQYDILFNEMRMRGAQISHSVQYPVYFNDTGVGMQAARDIGVNEVLFTFELETYLSPLNLMHKLAPVFEELDSFGGLLVTIAYEKLLGEKSNFARYLSLLDTSLLPLPRFWSTAELAELQDDLIISRCLQDKQMMQIRYMSIRSLLATHGHRDLYAAMTHEHYNWLVGIVQSRSFQGDKHTFATIPVADLVNHRARDYANWERDGTRFVFKTYNNGFRKGEQVFYNYGGGESNYHALADYAYVPFPNKDNFERIALRQVTFALVEKKESMLKKKNDGGTALHYGVRGNAVMDFFRLASARTEHELQSVVGFNFTREQRAASLCVSTLDKLIKSKPTSIAEDYELLHNATNYRLKLAIMYRIDAKTVLLRNKRFCERARRRLTPCLAKPNAFLMRTNYAELLRSGPFEEEMYDDDDDYGYYDEAVYSTM